jgi:hypothetical protein
MSDLNDVQVRSLEIISLKCPVTLTRIVQPCRTLRCRPHASCFCASAVPHLRASEGSRACPICSARFADEELTIDARLSVFLAEHSAAERAAVRRQPDGSFRYAAVRLTKPRPAEGAHATIAAQAPAQKQAVGPMLPGPKQAALRPPPPLRASDDEDARDAALPSAATVQLMVRFVPAAVAGSSADAERPPCHEPVGPSAASASAAAHSSADIYTALTRRAGADPRRPPESWHCSECCEWCVGDRSAHARTIAHQFARSTSRAALPAAAHVSLPIGNVGYRMLRGAGWEEGQGLGKANEGMLQPIATRLKRDRRGLRIMAEARDSDDEDARGGCPAHPPLRVTHEASEMMGPLSDSPPLSKADRRQQLRTRRAREAYLARCRELLATRSLLELDRPRSSG